MTHHIKKRKMKKIVVIVFTGLLFINCKEGPKAFDNQNLKGKNNISAEKIVDTVNNIKKNQEKVGGYDDTVEDIKWKFYKISESSISGTPQKTKTEIVNHFKDIKIEIDNKNLVITNICSYEYYKYDKTPVKYYQSPKTAKLYESVFEKNGLKLGSTLTVYQSLYPDKSCEMPWDEVLIVDNTLVIVYDDYLVFFKKGNSAFQNDCFSKTKITNLPITKKNIDGNNTWNQLECNIANLDTKDYLRLPDIDDVKVFIIGNFNFDDFTYTLITLKKDKVVTNKMIGFVNDTEGSNEISKLTEFEISNDYIISLSTKTKNGNNWKTIKKEQFKIDSSGKMIEVK